MKLFFRKYVVCRGRLLISQKRIRGLFLSSMSCVSSAGTQHRQQEKWIKPNPGTIKINFDGALFPQLKCSGVGILGRESNGRCLGWKTVLLPHVADAGVTEAFAVRAAAEYANEFPNSSIIIEGDCLEIINLLRNKGYANHPLGPLLHDVDAQLQGRNNIGFSFAFREANQAAHLLARNALSNNAGTMPPDYLFQVLCIDEDN
ncbi:hypothetical protein Salat_0870400 [Sesamum alatum]|uniref:RNase H type-1 domain-containing protein n=1 Tax=Sesamum alatum TaxID=300844 RepID=A0AAE1YIU8_9LAMI|nr:hypothetical protein Salat_0870400 [Sesamum alatum]